MIPDGSMKFKMNKAFINTFSLLVCLQVRQFSSPSFVEFHLPDIAGKVVRLYERLIKEKEAMIEEWKMVSK